jgi:D-serine deaminase-like pyridoxal phosphate-dependent protein
MAGQIDHWIGKPITDIDTPALVLDLDVMERNQKVLVDYLAPYGVKSRPHVKLHRATPEIAQFQVQSGARGLTCSKLNEAESLASCGFTDLLIANQIVGRNNIQRLANLARQIDIIVAVDSLENARELSSAAVAYGVTISVLIEVNIGQNRCGVAPFEPTVELAKAVVNDPGLNFRGLMGYDGHCTTNVSPAERGPLSTQANQLLAENRRAVERAGIRVEIVSGAGTFTYSYAAQVEGITEVQAGSYLLMDTAYQEHGIREFGCALRVLGRVISRPSYPGAGNLAIIDVGKKAMSTLLGNPTVKEPRSASVRSLSDEHGRIVFANNSTSLKTGETIELWVRDSNGTINQFDRFYAVRDDRVQDVWKIPNCGNHT